MFDVYAKGFEIHSENYRCVPVLSISEQKTKSQLVLVDSDSSATEEDTSETQVVLSLAFQYGKYTFRFDSFSASSNVSMEKRAMIIFSIK
jgi:hypothetical protein